MAPNEKTSERASAERPRTCSGDMWPKVPRTTPGSVAAEVLGSGRISLARPKSRIFRRPSFVMKMFSGFRSR
jgi:hypothetical protein